MKGGLFRTRVGRDLEGDRKTVTGRLLPGTACREGLGMPRGFREIMG
jgi:hypothetical protein